MSDYRNFDQVRTSELFVTRHKWFFPYYELTDGQFVYGKLSYRNKFRGYAVIETAQRTWTIKHKGWFNRTLLINRNDDETIGTLVPATWNRDVALKMSDGFEAAYEYKKLFARSFTLANGALGDILQITLKTFNFKQPYVITFDKTIQQTHMPPLPLLGLIGLHIILIRQRHAAAAT